MKFSRCLPLILVLLISGCGQIVIKERQTASTDGDKSTVRSVEQAEVKTEVATKAATLVRTPNPYLQTKRSVPAQAKKTFNQANGLIQAKKWQQAEKVLQGMIATYPQFSGPYLNLGIVYLQNQQTHQQAAQQFSKAISVNSNNLEAYNRLASLKRQQGEFAKAERLYQQALSVWPQHLPSNLNLGILYDLYLNDLTKAQHYYEVYQSLRDEKDRQVAGWIIDIKRRIKLIAQADPQRGVTP